MVEGGRRLRCVPRAALAGAAESLQGPPVANLGVPGDEVPRFIAEMRWTTVTEAVLCMVVVLNNFTGINPASSLYCPSAPLTRGAGGAAFELEPSGANEMCKHWGLGLLSSFISVSVNAPQIFCVFKFDWIPLMSLGNNNSDKLSILLNKIRSFNLKVA